MTVPDRALTLWQPWAWLVGAGFKPIENRPPGFSFKTFRGDFWIHAGAEPTRPDFDRQWASASELASSLLTGLQIPRREKLTFGAIIGRAKITGIIPPRLPGIRYMGPPVPWHFAGQYGFMVEGTRLLEKPVPCKGALGFWRVPPTVLEQLREVA